MTQSSKFNTKVTLFTNTTVTNAYGEPITSRATDHIVGGRISTNSSGLTQQSGLPISLDDITLELRETTRTRLLAVGDGVSIDNIGWILSAQDPSTNPGILRFTARREE